MTNMEIYNRYAQPPDDALKDFNNGKFKGTDINPMWRIRSLTEAFGPCGVGWYIELVRMWREDTPGDEATVYCHVRLYVKVDGEWSKPIEGVGGNTLTRVTKSGRSTTDEAYKMAYTDAIGIACKALGFGANIWWAGSDSKYTAYQEDEPAADQPDIKPFTPPAPARVQVSVRKVDRRSECNRLTDTYGVPYKDIVRTISLAVEAGEVTGINGDMVSMSDEDFTRCIAAAERRFKAAVAS